MEEIKKEIKICVETNENENMTTQNLWDSGNAVLRGWFITIQAYLKKREREKKKNKTKQETRETSNKQPNFTSKATRKRRNEEPQGWQKERNHKN